MNRRHLLDQLREARTGPKAQTAEGRLLRWCLAVEARLLGPSHGSSREVAG